VAHVRDGVRDAVEVGTGWVDWRSRDFRGNFVVIRHAEAECSLLAHLVPGGNFFIAASLPVAFTNTVLKGEKQTGPVCLSIGDLVERAQ